MKTSVFCENSYEKTLPFSVGEVQEYAEKFLSYVIENAYTKEFSAYCDYSFDVLLCDDAFIHEINREYRKIDRPTDVITFALFYDSEEKIVTDNTINLGQIIISIDKTNSQAVENNVEVQYEFLNLLAHGVLHLLGFDHPDDEQLENMLNIQNKMIESVNYVKI